MRLRKELEDMQEEELLLTAQISDALAHPARLKIFRYIYVCNRNRQTVCNKDVVTAFDYSQATISQHIKKLVDSGLVQVKKEDRFSYYYVNIGVLGKYLNAVKKFE
ncbi:MAG: winged helix-turn-helix transcriptional regulator [Clostridiales bacterium]|nr:winged helix-turn-helix transcriptional regulator [Clostridiales bacterium]